jgi:hypothetical protein
MTPFEGSTLYCVRSQLLHDTSAYTRSLWPFQSVVPCYGPIFIDSVGCACHTSLSLAAFSIASIALLELGPLSFYFFFPHLTWFSFFVAFLAFRWFVPAS